VTGIDHPTTAVDVPDEHDADDGDVDGLTESDHLDHDQVLELATAGDEWERVDTFRLGGKVGSYYVDLVPSEWRVDRVVHEDDVGGLEP
jgi:hypothetical protein